MSKIANLKYHVINLYSNMGIDLYKKRKCMKLKNYQTIDFFLINDI